MGAHGPRYAGAYRECRPAMAVLAVVPCVPARDRRPAEALLQAPGPLLDVDPGLRAQRQAHAAGLGVAVLGAGHRPVHPAGGWRRVRRSTVLLSLQARGLLT